MDISYLDMLSTFYHIHLGPVFVWDFLGRSDPCSPSLILAPPGICWPQLGARVVVHGNQEHSPLHMKIFPWLQGMCLGFPGFQSCQEPARRLGCKCPENFFNQPKLKMNTILMSHLSEDTNDRWSFKYSTSLKSCPLKLVGHQEQFNVDSLFLWSQSFSDTTRQHSSPSQVTSARARNKARAVCLVDAKCKAVRPAGKALNGVFLMIARLLPFLSGTDARVT